MSTDCFMMKKILLTGATGFIGRSYVENETQRPLRCVVRSDSEFEHDDCFTIESLSATSDWTGAFEGVDVVIHLAGLAHSYSKNDSELHEVNCLATLNFARQAAAGGVKRFVFVSTIGVNGNSTQGSPVDESSAVEPCSLYAESKYCAERGLWRIAEDTGLEVVVVRPPLVYGAKASGNFKKLIKLVRILPWLPFGAVENRRSLISVRNLVNFLYHCAVHPKAGGEVFVVADGAPLSIKEITSKLAVGMQKEKLQLPIPVLFISVVAVLVGKKVQAQQLLGDLEVDSTKARSLLSWQPVEGMAMELSRLS